MYLKERKEEFHSSIRLKILRISREKENYPSSSESYFQIFNPPI